MIPVEGHKNLFRDPRTGAIINNNMNSYNNINHVKCLMLAIKIIDIILPIYIIIRISLRYILKAAMRHNLCSIGYGITAMLQS